MVWIPDPSAIFFTLPAPYFLFHPHFQRRRGIHLLPTVRASGPRRSDARPAAARAETSPDGKWEAFVRDHNLFLRERDATREIQLTIDGSATNSYARNEQADRGD